jgi:hypothetical protein
VFVPVKLGLVSVYETKSLPYSGTPETFGQANDIVLKFIIEAQIS